MINPIGSMCAIYGNIYHQYTPNVSIYTIHGSYGNGSVKTQCLLGLTHVSVQQKCWPRLTMQSDTVGWNPSVIHGNGQFHQNHHAAKDVAIKTSIPSRFPVPSRRFSQFNQHWVFHFRSSANNTSAAKVGSVPGMGQACHGHGDVFEISIHPFCFFQMWTIVNCISCRILIYFNDLVTL